jgi:hypothetical protein
MCQNIDKKNPNLDRDEWTFNLLQTPVRFGEEKLFYISLLGIYYWIEKAAEASVDWLSSIIDSEVFFMVNFGQFLESADFDILFATLRIIQACHGRKRWISYLPLEGIIGKIHYTDSRFMIAAQAIITLDVTIWCKPLIIDRLFELGMLVAFDDVFESRPFSVKVAIANCLANALQMGNSAVARRIFEHCNIRYFAAILGSGTPGDILQALTSIMIMTSAYEWNGMNHCADVVCQSGMVLSLIRELRDHDNEAVASKAEALWEALSSRRRPIGGFTF